MKLIKEFQISGDQIECLIKELLNGSSDRALIRLLEWRIRHTEHLDSLKEIELNSSVMQLDLSPRARNRLIYSNVPTVKELIELPDKELFMIRNFGRASITEARKIRRELKQKFIENFNLDDLIAEEKENGWANL